ncbi:MAG: SNF2-related protein [Planctomycetota bacterium]|jgi:SNF2 family DNA or RNA helicase
MKPLWSHQQGAVDFVLSRKGSLLDMGMGSGKSRCVIEAIATLSKEQNVNALILCPKSVVPVWERQFQDWYPGRVGFIGVPEEDVTLFSVARGPKSWGSAKKSNRFEELATLQPRPKNLVLIANYDTAVANGFDATLRGHVWDIAVADESQRIKSPNGVTSKRSAGITAVRRLGLTGTPMPHSPLDIFGQARFIDRSVFGTSWTLFKSRYAVMGVVIPPTLPEPVKARLEALPVHQKVHAVNLLRTQKFRSEFRRDMRDQLVAWMNGQTTFTNQKGWKVRMPTATPFTPKQWGALGQIDASKLMEIVDYKNMDDMRAKLATFTYQVKTEDVIDLPEREHQMRVVRLDSATQEAYDGMQKDFVTWVRNGVAVTAANAMTKVGKLQQISGGFLILPEDDDDNDAWFADSLQSFMNDHGVTGIQHGSTLFQKGDSTTDLGKQDDALHSSSGKPVCRIGTEKRDALTDIMLDLDPTEPMVVFANFRPELDMIREAAENAGRPYFELSGRGDQSDEWRMASSDGAVIGVQFSSGSLGISLVEARYCAFFSMTFSLGDYEQALARIRRPGQKRDVVYFHLVGEGTIDEKIYKRLDKRKNLIGAVLEDLAGVTA